MKKHIIAVASVIVGAFTISCGVVAVLNKIAERNVSLLKQKEVYILFVVLAVLFGIAMLIKYKKGYSKRMARLLLKVATLKVFIFRRMMKLNKILQQQFLAMLFMEVELS